LIFFGLGKKSRDSIGAGFVPSQGEKSGRVKYETSLWGHFPVADLGAVPSRAV
jgi:hypothetical protein